MTATLVTIGTTAITVGEALTATAAVAGAAGTIYGGVASYQSGKAEAAANKSAALAAKREAEAQAAEQTRQAQLENTRAGIEQIQGEQEAEKRSRLFAQDIGSIYANYAGNGLMLDGTAKDTIGSALTSTAAEAAHDISTIRDSAAMNVWTRRANAGSLLASAANTRIAGHNQAEIYRSKARTAARSGRNQFGMSLLSATGTLAKGFAGLGSSSGGGMGQLGAGITG